MWIAVSIPVFSRIFKLSELNNQPKQAYLNMGRPSHIMLAHVWNRGRKDFFMLHPSNLTGNN